MKCRVARALRRFANKLGPQPRPQVYVTYNGQPVEAVVTETLRKLRRNGFGAA